MSPRFAAMKTACAMLFALSFVITWFRCVRMVQGDFVEPLGGHLGALAERRADKRLVLGGGESDRAEDAGRFRIAERSPA